MFNKDKVYVQPHYRKQPTPTYDDLLLLTSIRNIQQSKKKPKLKLITNYYYAIKEQNHILTAGKPPLQLKDNYKVALQLKKLEDAGLIYRKGSKYYLTEEGESLVSSFNL